MTTDSRGIPTSVAELPPEAQAQLQLTSIWPDLLPFEAYELRCLDTRTRPAGQGPRHFLLSVDEVVERALRYRDDWDVFVGVGTRACPGAVSMKGCQHEEKGGDHVSRIKAIWGDFDADSPEEFDDQLAKLTGLSLPPTILVASGKGVHAYWLLVEPTTDLPRVKRVNRGLRIRFGADNAIDTARILRLAGTFNYKYGEPLPVRLLVAPDV